MSLAWIIPTLLAPGAAMAAWSVWCERHHRRARRGIRRLEHYANHPAHRKENPQP